MLWPGIKKLGKELGFKRTNSEAAGTLKNCFIIMYDGAGKKVLEIFPPEIDDTDKEYILNVLNQNKIKECEWLNNGVRIIFQEYIRPYSMNKIKNIIFTIVEHFEQKYPDNIPNCLKCGMQKKAEVYSICNAVNETNYLCDDCLKKCKNDLNNKYSEYQQLSGNYFSGFIGALLFSIPGVFITVLSFVFLKSIAEVSALFYIIFGIIGYKIFKGKISPFGELIRIVVGIIMIGIGTLSAYSVIILKEIKMFDIDILLQILKMPEQERELWTSIVLSYVVYSFSIIYQLFIIIKPWRFSNYIIKKAREI